ncbi:MAG: oligopeptide:H+ symporter [Gammaproteobacteria bacterium]
MSALATLKQPRAFYLIFFIELWERFGYYGMQALIVLFFVKHLGYSDTHADNLFAAFSALVYLLPAAGGYVGDHLLGTKRTIILGTVILIIGYSALAIPGVDDINIPLAIIAVGVGLFKANPSSLLSKIYEGDEAKIDGGFTLYYMAVNLGSFFSMALTPVFSAIYGWHFAFAICAIGLVLALIFYIAMRHTVDEFGSRPDFLSFNMRIFLYVIAIVIALTALCSWLLMHYKFSGWLILIGGVIIFGVFIYEILKTKGQERKSLILCLVLMFQAIVFFVLYFQMPTSINLFTLRNIQHSLIGLPIEPASFQSLNPFWIIVLSPLLAMLYSKLAYHDKDLSMPSKFTLGTLLTGLGFLSIPLGAMITNHPQGIMSAGWLVLFYFLECLGELLVSALGLAMVSRFVPQRLMGFTMGAWFLCTSIAGIIAGKVASLASVPRNITDPLKTLPIYIHLFLEIGLITVAVSILMAFFVPLLKRLSHDVGGD